MNLNKMVIIVLVLLALIFLGTRAFAVELMPNVDAAFTATPTSGTVVTTVTRTLTLTNYNADSTKTIPVGVISITKGSYTLSFPINFTLAVPGARNGISISNTMPAEATFVSGSLKKNGVVQSDPTITGGNYTVTVDIPSKTGSTAGSMVVTDQWLVTPPLP